ncbi:MAG: ArgR family transcriptional regulator [Spirochaetales bacterium]|nr:ArgR family transcriptional regulator [Spirochaetales bacterium]
MKERSQRLKAIRSTIRSNRISSQESLLGFLEAQGFSITQATLSRDLKLLKVGKVSKGPDGYFYSLPSEEERRESERSYLQDFQRGYVGLEFSANLGIIRTLPGHANSVALAIDNIPLKEILGTVAGDDTVLIVLREGYTSQNLIDQLSQRIPDFEP